MSVRELGELLGISEGSAVSYIGLLASTGRLIIDRVSLPGQAERRRDSDRLGRGVLREVA